MRVGRRAATLVAGLVVVAGLSWTPAARAAVPDLWAGPVAGCSDTGAGTQAVPYCHLQAALDVVLAGQTVHPLGRLEEHAVLRRSGVPGSPVVVASASGPGPARLASPPTRTGPALTLAGVHDVVVRAMAVQGTNGDDAVAVTGSVNVTLDQVYLLSVGPRPGGTAASVLTVDGTSAGTTLQDSTVDGSNSGGLVGAQPGPLTGVRIAAGASRTTVRHLDESFVDVAVDAASGPGLAVTNVTATGVRCTGVRLHGTGDTVSPASVQNTVVGLTPQSFPWCTAPAAAFSVDALAVPTTHLDYDVATTTRAGASPYLWQGVAYPDAAAFHAATGEGTHDLTLGAAPAAGDASQLVDSGNLAAPGVDPADPGGGVPVVDDPLTPDTGVGHLDRGARELQDSAVVTASTGQPTSPAAGAVPWTASLTVTSPATSHWGVPLTHSVDWGDGTAAVSATPGVVVHHVYSTPGARNVVVMATGPRVVGRTIPVPYVAATAAPVTALITPQAPLDAAGALAPHEVDAAVTFAQPAQLASSTTSLDGVVLITSVPVQGLRQRPARDGVHTVTVTTTDVLGRTTTASRQVTSGSLLESQQTPSQWTGTIAANGTVLLSRAMLGLTGWDPLGTPVLTLDVRPPAAGGFLTVHPQGATDAGTNALAYGAHLPASGLVFAAGTGATAVTNHGSAPVSVTVMLAHLAGGTSTVTAPAQTDGAWFAGPQVRVFDTRTGLRTVKAAIGPGQTRILDLRGVAGIPSVGNSTAALDLTMTGAAQDGDLAVSDAGTLPGGTFVEYVHGQARTSLVTVLSGGRLEIHNEGPSSVQVIGEVTGHLAQAGTTGSLFVSLPTRHVVDSRTGLGTARARVPANGTVRIRVAGLAGVPAAGVTSAVLGITAVHGGAAGILTTYASGTTAPGTADLVYPTSQAVTNVSIAPVGADGSTVLVNRGTQPVDVLVDLQGYFFRP